MRSFISTTFLLFLYLFSFSNKIYSDVFVNQLGYLSASVKYVVSSTESDSFFICDNQTNEVKFIGSFESLPIQDASTGLTIYSGDFSSFTAEGTYYIALKSGVKSYPFTISNEIYKDAFYKVQRGFYYWRCGKNLLGSFAEPYFHNACHTTDGFYHSTTGLTGFTQKPGGWHDAGDYGKYIVNGGISVGTMLMAYELFPERFKGDDFNIPESGNSIPDILDENRYEIEWFLKMQNTDGGVFHKLTKKDFEGTVMPNNDTGQRFIYQVSSTATGDFAAVCAMAARIYKSFDQEFADNCLEASKKAWDFLEANPSIIPSGGFKNPSDTHTGEYGDGNDSDERLWAATELFLSTGEEKYHQYFKTNYNKSGLLNQAFYWPDVKSLAQLSYLMSTSPSADASIKQALLNGLKSYCNYVVNLSATDGMGVAIPSTGYYWGSNSDVLNRAIMLILAYSKTGNQSYYNVALQQLNYIYGVNGHNISFVTGTGTKSVMHPHHRPSQADGITNPVPGYVAGGPNNHGTGGDKLLDNLISKGTPPAMCYLDQEGSWASNEVCLNWNSPLVFVTGYFNGEGTAVSVDEGEPVIPRGIYLRQNYPNPFNGMTKIRFTTKERQNITFKVYDLLGNLVTNVNLGEVNSGDNQYTWNANDLTSGIYFYYLEGKEKSGVNKLIHLK